MESSSEDAAHELSTGRKRRGWRLLSLAIALVLLGGGLAAWVQSDFGNVSVRDVRFSGGEGRVLSALLYVPDSATTEAPAPGVLAIHGFMNSRETQNPFAIELARRGYVVLALDQTGHGYSDGPAFAGGWGGPDGLAYLRSLDVVDLDNIGLSGHSMGTWAALAAAAAFPDGYRSFVIESSAPGAAGSPEGTADFPRNTAVVSSSWEEFSALFWETPTFTDAPAGERMMALFGTDQPVEEDVLYGSIEDGTGRILRPVTTIHPGLHWNPTATAHVVDWFDQTLDGGRDVSGQTWWLKELGTLVALLGGILFVFAAGSLLLNTPFFSRMRQSVPAARGLEPGVAWWSGAAVATAIPALTFFYVLDRGSDWFEPNRVFPQSLGNAVLVWAGVVAGSVIVLTGAWHLFVNRRKGARLVNYGLVATERSTVGVSGRAALLALTLGAGVWTLLWISDLLFLTDFRFWIFNLKVMDSLRFGIFLAYLVPLAVIFVVIMAMLHGQFRPAGRERSLARAMVANAVILVAGIAVLIIADYVPLLLGGTLWVDTQPLLAIVAGFQFIPILALVAVMSTYFFQLTGTVYTGAFLSSLFVSWNLAAGQVIEAAAQPWDTEGVIVRVGLPALVGLILLVAAAVPRRRHVPAPEGREEQPLSSDSGEASG